MSKLIVHHLQVSQSERIPWLCEELGLDYELKTYKRAPIEAPPEYKALHPHKTAPVIQYGDLTLAESGACVEWISHKLAGGKLFVQPSASNYADFLYWFHFANATLQSGMSRALFARFAGVSDANEIATRFLNRNKLDIQCVEMRLKDNDYLAGNEFTAADIMTFWCFTNGRYFSGYSLAEYPNIQRYVQRISSREGYKKAMKKADPELKLALDVEAPSFFATGA